MVIDAHHHLWRYTRREYGWISDAMVGLRRDFLPADLHAEMVQAGVDGAVSVQARQTLEETAWLLDLAEHNDFLRGVVGWVPLVSLDVRSDLARFAAHKKLRAVRHVLQDEPDGFMLRDDFNHGVASLGEFELGYDILIFERQLAQAVAFVDRHPRQMFILDHVAKPRIREGAMAPWREQIRELAKRPQVYCKISGMVTEADWKGWTAAQLGQYVDVVLEAFGPRRLMFGSDWPVCLAACGYARWRHVVGDLIAHLSPAEQGLILGGTAVEAYGLT